VLIVDDHAGFRESARALLEAEGFSVLGSAADGAAAMTEVARLQPDVVLLDVQLPGLDGFAVAERLEAAPAPPQVVLISSSDAAAYGPRIDAAPVHGFLAKRAVGRRAGSAHPLTFVLGGCYGLSGRRSASRRNGACMAGRILVAGYLTC